MADAKIITYGELISATTDVVPDNQTVALDIESLDGKEYVRLDTTDGTERLILGNGDGGSGIVPTIIGNYSSNRGAYPFIIDNGSQWLEMITGGTNKIKSQAATNFQIGTHAAHTLELITANTARLHIDASGLVGIGDTVPVHKLHIQDGDAAIVTNNADDATAKSLIFKRSKSNTDGTAVVVADDDILGNIEFQGAEDGDSWATGAKIFARVNGAPGDGDMPTELVLGTSPDGSETVAECQVISQDGSTNFMQKTANWYLPTDNTDTTPRFQIHAEGSGTVLETKGDAYVALGSYDTERMRVNSSGLELSNGLRKKFSGVNDFYQNSNEMRMDLSLASSAIWVMDADIDEVKFGWFPGTDQFATFTAIIQQNATGDGSANSIAWPATATGYSGSFGGSTYNSIPIYWPGGTKPTITTGANAIDVIHFLCSDEGETRRIFAHVIGQDFQQ